MTANEKGIEIARQQSDGRAAISEHGIEIRYKGKPVDAKEIHGGYVYLVVDCSGSMEGDKLNQAKKGALNFAKDALIKGYYTGLIRFDSSASLLCEPQRETSALERCLKQLETGDTTNMAEAINLAHTQLKGISRSRVMVIITDGMPNGPDDPEASLRAGERAKKDGIDIITIGTDDADHSFLKKLASRSELGIKVSSKQLQQTITASVRMLPAGGDSKSKK